MSKKNLFNLYLMNLKIDRAGKLPFFEYYKRRTKNDNFDENLDLGGFLFFLKTEFELYQMRGYEGKSFEEYLNERYPQTYTRREVNDLLNLVEEHFESRDYVSSADFTEILEVCKRGYGLMEDE